MPSQTFTINTKFKPCGDQPRAIEELVAGLQRGERYQTLLGVTGSGKTFTTANVIEKVQRPTLLIAHNKTLAAQLYGEMRDLFPNNAVHYFVSYYDYYQPEAYVPASDTFIEKDSSINDEIDRMRHAATHSLLSRHDVIVVASVSCIYGIGNTASFREMGIELSRNQRIDRDTLLRQLVDIHYRRNDYDFSRGAFRVRGDVVEIFPAHQANEALRVEFFGDEIEYLRDVDPLRGNVLAQRDRALILPSSHYVTPEDQRKIAIDSIRVELCEQLTQLKAGGRLVQAQRLEERTLFDLEMLEEMGHCSGIENYSRHLSQRCAGAPPPTLLDYFPDNFLVIIDESHQTIPQLRAMYRGDQSRKRTLVEHGFRLPSALDNRPLEFNEFQERVSQVIHVSATPSAWEIEASNGVVVEQIIRPTGLIDPVVTIRPVSAQVDDLLDEIQQIDTETERVLVTTLTKRMAEDLSEYLQESGVETRYLHSDINTLERSEVLSDLRRGVFHALVGINLLREGLDLPEVVLVAILDADKEGFLRGNTALIQTMGRASRNVKGRVIMYADRITDSMRSAIDETDRRRMRQIAYNEVHGIVPVSATRSIVELRPLAEASSTLGNKPVKEQPSEKIAAGEVDNSLTATELSATIVRLEKKMKIAARELAFEDAARLRDRIQALRDRELEVR